MVYTDGWNFESAVSQTPRAAKNDDGKHKPDHLLTWACPPLHTLDIRHLCVCVCVCVLCVCVCVYRDADRLRASRFNTCIEEAILWSVIHWYMTRFCLPVTCYKHQHWTHTHTHTHGDTHTHTHTHWHTGQTSDCVDGLPTRVKCSCVH